MVGQFSLAFMYENGRGVPRNMTEARRLYTLSANQGYAGVVEGAARHARACPGAAPGGDAAAPPAAAGTVKPVGETSSLAGWFLI